MRSKIGFHSGPTGNMNGIGAFWRALSNAGIPIFHKATDHYGPIYEILTAVPNPHNIDHNLLWRVSTQGQNNGYDYDVPPYHLPPQQAAAIHWQATAAKIPPESVALKDRFWIEPINEVDKNRADWLGWFGLEIAQLANAQGYKVALFGFSSGEPGNGDPDPNHWATPGMLAYLRYCQSNPNRAAVSLHEYNFNFAPYENNYPWNVGRFQWLFNTCDQANISRPRVFMTEWGWSHNAIPAWDQAQDYLNKTNALYCKYPQIAGAALWNLGGGWGDIDDQTQAYIAPLTQYTLTKSFYVGGPNEPLDPVYFDNPPPPNNGHKAIVVKAPQEATRAEWAQLAAYAYDLRHTITASHDDTLNLLLAGNADSYAKIYKPQLPSQQQTILFLEAAGIGWQELVLGGPQPPPQAVDLAPYFQVASPGNNGPFYVFQHVNGPTEDIQHQIAADGVIYIVKNSQWEQLRVANGYIWRGIDTSPGNGQYYKLRDEGIANWSKWCPSHWEIGRIYERRPYVQFYNKSDCGSVGGSSQHVTYLRFFAYYATWQSPSGLNFNNVIELHWLLSPTGGAIEKYWYAKGVGMVQWKNDQGAHSYISELPPGRPPLVREVIACL